MAIIYVVIVILFISYILWTWNNMVEFKTNGTRILFLLVGTIIVGLVTLILFNISKAGVAYPKQEMVKDVRKIILLVFTPINSLVVLPQIARVLGKIKKDKITQEEFKKRAIIFLLISAIIVVVECMYFKNIQMGIINLINSR